MRAAIKETGSAKLFSANITADDPNGMIARGKFVLSQFGPLGESCAFLVEGYVAGGTAITVGPYVASPSTCAFCNDGNTLELGRN
jgi:ribulose-bisphosphate carboxylase large chain